MVALVIDGQRDPVLSEQLRGLYGATPGQRDVLIEVLRAGDHSRRRPGIEAHSLLLVEFRILEGGKPFQLIQ